jgi:glutamyl/glutaminyl-tRNA synthetase
VSAFRYLPFCGECGILPRMSDVTTRFAPSPTGYLHLGHAFSAFNAWRRARDAGGRFLLRLEDIDPARCRPDSYPRAFSATSPVRPRAVSI